MTTNNPFIEMSAPAKVNLFLHVIGKTADNYHKLQSLVYFADFGDSIIIEPAEKFSFHTATNEINNTDNIIIKTARLLSQAVDKPLNCKITLNKQIPIGAGLGGGSSDAATTVKGLLKFWGTDLPTEQLAPLLLQLGADVPCCYHGQACYFENIGEIITPLLNVPQLHGVLINPNKHCDTANIFKGFSQSFSQEITLPTHFENTDEVIAFLKQQKNDLSESAANSIPEISDILNTLEQSDKTLFSAMSGSGATCFALLKDKESAEQYAQDLKANQPQWWVQSVMLN